MIPRGSAIWDNSPKFKSEHRNWYNRALCKISKRLGICELSLAQTGRDIMRFGFKIRNHWVSLICANLLSSDNIFNLLSRQTDDESFTDSMNSVYIRYQYSHDPLVSMTNDRSPQMLASLAECSTFIKSHRPNIYHSAKCGEVRYTYCECQSCVSLQWTTKAGAQGLKL